jgi:hypothetical protein
MKQRPLRALLMAGLLLAAAAPAAPPAAAAVIGKDTRETFADHAQSTGTSLIALRWRFGASGLLECPGRLASAQVVGDRWTILTSAHNVLDDAGKFPWALDTCVFVVTGIDGRTVEYRISTRNWRLGTRRPARNRYQDWAVLTLEAPVPATIEPYEIENPRTHPLPRRAAITVIAASHDNWPGHSRRVSSIEQCRLRRITVPINGRRNLMGFDCDTGKGASGAGLLLRVRTGYRLIGIGVGERNRRRGAPYDGARHFNAAVPLHRRIYDAIRAVERQRRRNAAADSILSLPELR